jgi:hypothetical protein
VGTKAKVMVFWDYDTQWGGDRSRTPGGAKNWGHLEFPETERLLELHAEYGVPACFAIVGSASLPGERPYHDPVQIRRIHEAGHEVASHSFRHEWLPGLGRSGLMESLRVSKDALEQCIGAPVVSFVPPYNQPFDCLGRLSISLSERKEAGKNRVDLGMLCDALRETGHAFCRVAYRPAWERIARHLTRRGPGRPGQPGGLEMIGGIHCMRLNAPGGFDAHADWLLGRCAEVGGLMAVGGHPHSLHAGNTQDETRLVPFLRRVRDLQQRGLIEAVLPKQIIGRE